MWYCSGIQEHFRIVNNVWQGCRGRWGLGWFKGPASDRGPRGHFNIIINVGGWGGPNIFSGAPACWCPCVWCSGAFSIAQSVMGMFCLHVWRGSPSVAMMSHIFNVLNMWPSRQILKTAFAQILLYLFPFWTEAVNAVTTWNPSQMSSVQSHGWTLWKELLLQAVLVENSLSWNDRVNY